MSTPATKDDGDSIFNVTVVMPCHNHATFLERSVGSVVSQDYERTRLVIVNDGSSDNSFEVASDLSRRYENVEVVSNEHPTGPSAARNLAIKHAWETTDFFMQLDADDSYLPGKISKSVDIMSKDVGNIGLVYADVLIENISTGSVVLELRKPYTRNELEHECMVSNTPLINKLALSRVGLYDEDMRTAEDWDMWLRITEHFVAVHIPEPLSTYSVTGSNASNTVSADVWNKNWAKIQSRISNQHG